MGTRPCDGHLGYRGKCLNPSSPERLHDTPPVCTGELSCRAASPGAVLQLIEGVATICIAIADPGLRDAPPSRRLVISAGKLESGAVPER